MSWNKDSCIKSAHTIYAFRFCSFSVASDGNTKQPLGLVESYSVTNLISLKFALSICIIGGKASNLEIPLKMERADR